MENNYRFIIGKASLKGTDREVYSQEISYLANNRCVDPCWNVTPKTPLAPMQIVDTSNLEEREVFHRLPALIRAYLSMGANIAQQPYPDFTFGSVELFIMVDSQNCNQQYISKLLKK